MVDLTVDSGPRLKIALNDVLGGTAASVLTAIFGLSYSLLILAGPLAPSLSCGVATTFTTSAILGVVLALRSSFPFAIAAPESSTAAMTAILASSLVEQMATTSPSAQVIGSVLLTFGMASIATGIGLCAFGETRMQRAIRYVPYPVVGGFLGATGYLILLGAIRVITGLKLQFATLDQSDSRLTPYELGAAGVMALVLYLIWHRTRTPFGLPVSKLVTGIDSSAAYSFAQIKRASKERGIKLALAHLTGAAEKTLRSSKFISKEMVVETELDRAPEWCENEIIRQHQGREQEQANLRGWFAQLLGGEQDAAELIRRCERLDGRTGDIVVRAGDMADFMHFVRDGRVGVMIPADHGGTTRVRSLGHTIGEMGLVAQAPRSPTIRAEVASILYVLTTPQFEAIKRENKALGQKLATYLVSVMAERLTFANRMIAVLRR